MNNFGREQLANYNSSSRENIFTEDTSAQMIYERLIRSGGRGIIGLDVDGVIFSGNGNEEDRWINPDTPELLANLHTNFQISLITTRNASVLDTISQHTAGQVNLYGGKHSLDKGCVRYDGTTEQPLCPVIKPRYKELLHSVDELLFDEYNASNTWSDVLWGRADWCKGDPRWQSEYMRSIWYRDNDRVGKHSTGKYLTDKITERAQRLEADISLTHHRQPSLNLAWCKLAPKGITKASPIIADPTMLPDIYINDGAGEKNAIVRLREDFFEVPPPLMVVIGESPDELTPDIDWCRSTADILIPTVDKTYKILQKVNAMAEQQRH